MSSGLQRSYLLVQCRSWHCALPLTEVVETMRPLPLQSVAGVPRFVLGLSLIRGELIPVVDLARILGAEGGEERGAEGGRLVVVRTAERRLALAVDAVLRVLPPELAEGCKVAPLLRQALPAEVAALAVLDGAALAVLESVNVLPEGAWTTLGPQLTR